VRVLVCAVGHRTEHWEAFFSALAARPDLELDVLVADVTELTVQGLAAIARRHPGRFCYRVARHLIGEQRTGHMASITYAPGTWKDWPARRPDVVHLIGEPSYLSTAQALAICRRRWPGVPVSHYAAQNIVIGFPWPFGLLERRASRNIDLALPITTAARDVLRAKGYGGRTTIVPLGVDRTRFSATDAAPGGPFTVGFVGRLEPHKGIADLLHAARIANCRLLVVGDGSLRGAVKAEAMARPGDVELVPWSTHDQLPTLLGRMHVLALPSIEIVQRNVLPWMRVPLREQFGRVLVEAMSCGVPCIASHVGEMGDVLGPAGMLVKPGDAPALGAAFARLRDDAALASSFRAAALQRAERFGWHHITAEMHALWQDLVLPGDLARLHTTPAPDGADS
jgi:glycosyltransferase involved in cell wall biosynthesis